VLSAEIQRAAGDYPWPRGYGISLGARFSEVEKGGQQRLFALILSVTFVFLLMGVLFESFVLPLSIVLSIPFAFTGVYWSLWLAGQSLDVMAGVGLVILVGIVVNNAIVLVDIVGERRRSGLTRMEALVGSAEERLRPILMTALTTIFGLIPMAFGSASLVGVPYKPLGLAVMGGLVASTVLTLVVVPLFYTWFDDLSRIGRSWVDVVVRGR
jgi:HAE1 family hydrophobic/amphiphilic exporter-1